MDVAWLCSELVKIRSENPPGYTDEVVEFLHQICTEIGFPAEIVKKGRKWNLLSSRPTGKLLLCGHIDVVPALDEAWTHPPFSGIIADDRIQGRGSTDMKGGCAALLSALAEEIDHHDDLDVDLAFVCDEEGNGDFGMEYLVLKRIIKPKPSLIAEPTPVCSPIIGEKGVLRFHISFSGDAGHASLHPVHGNSAIMQSCRFLRYCQDIHSRTWPDDAQVTEVIENTSRTLSSMLSLSREDTRTMLSRVSYNPGLITGGERINVIAQKCELDLDMRIPWGCNIDSLVDEIQETFPDASFSVTDLFEPSISRQGWLCRLVCEGIHQVHGTKALPGVTPAASDARHLRETGVEVVNYGPGDMKLLHSVNESVPIRMLEDCRDVYRYVLRNM
ncbi:MAG: M20/M25/M40 family metallo-hydrolase [Methanospirillum sp.]|nr:M20/M25/M40 family metallo-hydrolase [Methanospirillum sp.]